MLDLSQVKRVLLWILLVAVLACGCAKTEPSDSQEFIDMGFEACHCRLRTLTASTSRSRLSRALRGAIGPARVVGVGESRHDTREQLLLKGLLVRHLIEESRIPCPHPRGKLSTCGCR